MVDLARQAFNFKNYDLAAEIYERFISENGPNVDILIGLADSFAKGGHFDRAFDAYSKAFRVGKISSEKLKVLVSALVNCVKQDPTTVPEMNKNVMFDCLLCRNILNDPVTIPCGHTFCRSCLMKDQTKQCKNCGTVNPYLNVPRIKTNIVLLQTIEKWFSSHSKAVRLKKRANSAFQKNHFDEAICIYSEAVEIAPSDHLLWSNRSHAYASLDRYKEALDDAEQVLKLRPDWPKGYFRRGCALYGLGRYEESVVALLQCLALDSTIETAKDYLSKALHNILSPLTPDDPKSAELQRTLNPSLLDSLIRSNFDSSMLLPAVTVDTVRQLKDIITDTIASANTFLEGKDVEQEDGHQNNVAMDWNQMDTRTSSQTDTKCSSAPTSHSNSPFLPRKRTLSSSGSCDFQKKTTGQPGPRGPDGASGNNNAERQTAVLRTPPVDPSLLNREEFECSLCYRLLHLPVTTPCGHMYCRQCLDRCLDHRTECPLCKSSLTEYLAERRQAITTAVEKLLEVYFPAEVEQRKKQHDEELADLIKMGEDNQHEIPVFVCTMAYPSISCPLHIFEPRYRLMIRQCMESGLRQFGMCIANGDRMEDFSDFGCMLEIRNVQFFPDGRSVVDTVGGKRFKVISRGRREGYNTAKVEFLSDQPSDSIEELTEMSQRIYAESKNWMESLPRQQQQQILQHVGEFPDGETDNNYGMNGSTWHWWMIAVLPLDPRIQLAMLAMTSYKERLQGLARVIGYLRGRRESR